jgi:hypothetical protein
MTIGVNHAGFRTAVLLGLLATGWIVADPLMVLAGTAPTERAPASTVAFAPISPSQIESLAGPFAVDLANEEPSSTSTGVGGDVRVGDGKAGLIYAQLAIALAGLLIIGGGAFAIANRASLRGAFSRG